MKIMGFAAAFCAVFCAWQASAYDSSLKSAPKPTVSAEAFGKTSSGEEAKIYTLKNAGGMVVRAMDFGATVTEISVPDKNGVFENVVLSLPDLKSYEGNSNYFGPVVGRFGNRLGDAKIVLDGREYKLNANENDNILHGGAKGFNKVVWKSEAVSDRDVKGVDFAGVKFSRVSPDGEMGFPGNLSVEILYTLNNLNEFAIEYRAVSDKTTVCNLTLHPYFNLAGAGNGDVLTQYIQIPASTYTEVDSELIPTGKILNVENTPFDFRKIRPLGSKIRDFSNPQLKIAKGYDHNFNLDKPVDALGLAVRLYNAKNCRMLEILSQEPALQFYSCQGFDGSLILANGKPAQKYGAFVLEPQHAPDNPNQNFFPSSVLKVGETYSTKTIYRFKVVSPEKVFGLERLMPPAEPQTPAPASW
ncbi:MAG: galactose mutarotase [Opitutales bacterium]|nr:galactose mutarotase [Opitutales bacterium]